MGLHDEIMYSLLLAGGLTNTIFGCRVGELALAALIVFNALCGSRLIWPLLVVPLIPFTDWPRFSMSDGIPLTEKGNEVSKVTIGYARHAVHIN